MIRITHYVAARTHL